jgi:hypothetical protein
MSVKTNANPPAYPVKKPDANIAANVIQNTVYSDAMQKLQRTKTVDGVTQYYFNRSDVAALAKDKGAGDARLAANNMLRYFKQTKTTTVDRDTMMSFINNDTRQALQAAAGKDGKITAREKDKLPGYIRDDFDFVTTGKL